MSTQLVTYLFAHRRFSSTQKKKTHQVFLRWCPFLYFSLLGNYKITTECDDNCCMLVCLFTFFPLLFKHCTAASQTFSKTTGVNKEICMIILGALQKNGAKIFTLEEIILDQEGRKQGFVVFCSFIKSLRDYGKKSILITNQQQFSIFSTSFFFWIEFFLSNISSISTKRFQIKTYLNKKERVVGFLSTDITHKIALDIHRMNKNVVKIQLKSI